MNNKIRNSDRTPPEPGYYSAIDSTGYQDFQYFDGKVWLSKTGNVIEYWIEDSKEKRDDDLKGSILLKHWDRVRGDLTESVVFGAMEEYAQQCVAAVNKIKSNDREIALKLLSALKELVELKEIKTNQGETEDYWSRKPAAWAAAKRLVHQYKNYGVKA